MDYRFEQRLEQSLQLKLTPAVYFHLQVLQMPLVALEEAVKNEVESNPFLELEEEEGEGREEVRKMDSVPDVVFEGGNVFPVEEKEEMPIVARKSIREILLEQARLELKDEEFSIAEEIINNLDKRGFLTLPVEAISGRLGVPTSVVEKVRETVKRFSPVGCASYTVEESFAVQMEELGVPEKFIKAVFSLSALAAGKERFKQETGLSDKEVEEFLCILRRLDPEPGNSGEDNVRIVPDVRVYLMGEDVRVEITSSPRFKLRVNTYYLKYATSEELRRFINEKYQRALNVMKALEQREETLKKVGEFVFSVQKEFLKDGVTLKPLTYQDVALALSIHESTVSRAVKDKFVETPFGVYPFRYFFRKSLSGVASDSVRRRIKELIENEDKRRPLSDSKIAEILKEEGIKIARRTVAKYREEMGIPSAFKRRVK